MNALDETGMAVDRWFTYKILIVGIEPGHPSDPDWQISDPFGLAVLSIEGSETMIARNYECLESDAFALKGLTSPEGRRGEVNSLFNPKLDYRRN